ncbi:MAG: DUF3822 family protein [Bernardetiaceae bacterium]|nr:DUF3822 family protein [Bernardetiaceae bacterium]
MDTKTATFQTVKQIRDDAFSIEHISRYALCLKVLTHSAELAVLDTEKRRFMAYEYYTFEQAAPVALASIFHEHAFASAGYWKKVLLVSAESAYTLVPQEFYDEDQAPAFLQTNARFNPAQSYLLSHLHRSQNLVSVFTVNRALADLIESQFPNAHIQFINQAGGLLEGLSTTPNLLDARYLHLLVENELLVAAFFRNGSLHFVNTFHYQSPEDLLYFVLLVANQHGLLQNEVQLMVRGAAMMRHSALLGRLREYFRYVSFGDRPLGFTFAYHFDELDNHLAFDLFGAAAVVK